MLALSRKSNNKKHGILALWSEAEGALRTFEFGFYSGDGSDDELTIIDFDAEGSFSEEQPEADVMVKQPSVSGP